jgi:hypothetical protein
MWIFAILVGSLTLPALATDCSGCLTSRWPSTLITPGEPTYTVASCNPWDPKGSIPSCQTVQIDQYTSVCEGSQRVSYQQGCKEYIEDPICPPWGCGGILAKAPMVPLLLPVTLGI